MSCPLIEAMADAIRSETGSHYAELEARVALDAVVAHMRQHEYNAGADFLERKAPRPALPTLRERALARLRKQLATPDFLNIHDRDAMELALQALQEGAK